MVRRVRQPGTRGAAEPGHRGHRDQTDGGVAEHAITRPLARAPCPGDREGPDTPCAAAKGAQSIKGDQLNTPPTLHEEDFTRTNVADYRQLMTDLISACRAIGERYPHGWQPHSTDLQGEFGASMSLIADISRTLNHTRRGIRRINDEARHRSYSRAAEPASYLQ